MPNLYMPVIALILSFIILIIYYSKKRVNLLENKLYSIMLISIFIDSLCVSSLFYNVYTNYNETLVKILNKIDYFSLMIWSSSLLIYIFTITYNKRKNFKKRFTNFTIVISLINIIMFFVVGFADIEIVLLDVLKQTAQGPAVNISIVTCLIYIILALMIVLFNIKNITKKHLPVFIIIFTAVVIAILFSTNPFLICISIGLTLDNLIMYFTIENPDVKMINELEYAKNTAEKANRAKSDFLSSMSHEIRTPLNAIVGLSECIKNSDNIEEIHEDANDVVMASNNLLEIVNGILDISKIEADKMEIIETNYNPVELFDDVATIAKTRIGEKDIDLRCNFAEDIPNTLYGDKGKLKRIITNVLSNAVKYTEEGHIKFNVSCINERDKSNLQIIITDTGRGIKPDQIDKIFNKFERAEEDKNSTIEGTRLGLAITKSLVEMMGGKILVHSTYGEGSKFTIFLEQKYSKAEEKPKVVKDEKVSYSDKRVLVVDDNKLNIKVASKVLSEFELNIDSADSGFSAIEKIENNEHYDIIFMDIMMPKMSGVETLKKLKEIDNFNTPVVALTADAMEGKSTKYIEVGFNDYLSKPINKEELKRVLNKCLNGNIEIEEEKTPEEDPHIHRVIPITDEDIEMLNRKLAEDLAKQQEQEEKEKNNN